MGKFSENAVKPQVIIPLSGYPKLIIKCVMALFFLLVCANTFAAEVDSESGLSTESIDNEQIESLIETLESESARQDFIENLKTLIEVDSQKENDALSVSDLLNFDETSNSLSNQYLNTLTKFGDKVGLSGSAIGKLILVLLGFCIVLIIVMLNKWLAKSLNKKTNHVRKKLHLSKTRFAAYFKIQTVFGYIVGTALFFYAVSEIYNLNIGGEDNKFSMIIIETIATAFLISVLFVSIWELVNAAIEFVSHKNATQSASSYGHSKPGGLRISNARIETLIPLIRNLLLCILILLSSLVVLSELGIDIMPLLAGAGVLGIAVGFGAQTLVKDFLTGFIIILEDLLQVGDVVNVGDRHGIVEKITIRKIQLRDLDGTVHTVPFSEVNVVDNLTKDYSYYLMDIGVAYREDTDQVIECLKSVGEVMQKDEDYKNLILDKLEILGVDKFADSAVIIKARIRTLPHEKWVVGREFNRRMKQAFDNNKIEIPFPHQTVYFGEDKEGNAPKAPLKIYQAEASSNQLVEKNKKSKQSLENGKDVKDGKTKGES